MPWFRPLFHTACWAAMTAYVRLLFSTLMRSKQEHIKLNRHSTFACRCERIVYTELKYERTSINMMIFFNKRLAFLAVPKTGTSALERALGSKASATFRDPPGLKHTNARGFEKKFRHLFERPNLPAIETMAIMREPVAWLGSWYRYRQREALNGHPNSTKEVSFDAFVEAYLSESPPAYAHLGSQARFVTDSQGDLLVNHLFSYNDLDEARRFMEHRLDLKISLPTVNVSPRANISLDPDVEKQLRQKCSLDFQIYSALEEGPLSLS